MWSRRRFLEAVSEVKAAKAIDHDEANAQLTSAVHLQPNPTNIDAYEKFLEAQR